MSAGQRTIQAAMRTAAERVLAADGYVADRREGRQICDPGSQAARAGKAGVSRYTQQKLDRLARDRPDLLAEVRAGRLSAHRAALEAGIVKEAAGDGRAGSPDAPDRPPWRTVREALDRLAGCPVPVERLAADIPLYRANRMAANARRASQLLAVLAARLDERAAAGGPKTDPG